MTPALRETAMKGHGIYLSSLSSGEMESNETLSLGNARAVQEKIKDGSVTQITCSVLGFPAHQSNLNNDLFTLNYFGSQSSKPYALLMNPDSTFSANNKNCMQRKSEEHQCSRMTNPLSSYSHTQFRQIINSESEEQVKGEALSGATTENFSKTGKVLDLQITKVSSAEEKQRPHCQRYWKNGFLGKALCVNTDTQNDLFHQGPYYVLEATMNCSPSSKEQELNFRFLQCVNKQQVLLSRAKRTQKRLQILLARHVVKHCDQQMKCFVRHQLQRMKAFHDPASGLGSSYHRSLKEKAESGNLEGAMSKDVQHDLGVAAEEIKMFTRSKAGLLSQVETDLDSEATCSSSSEDDGDGGGGGGDHVSRNVVAVNCRSDWKWLVDRARVGSRWTWLQAQISELEYKIQQLTDLHRQSRATKGMVILEECSNPKERLKKQTQLMNQEASLNTTTNAQTVLERPNDWPELDFEMSPGSPTLLLQNIEKQSAQLSEIISSLISPLSLSPTASPLSSKSSKSKQKELVNGISLRDSGKTEEIASSNRCLSDQQQLKRKKKDRPRPRASSAAVMSTSARTRPLQSFHRRKLYKMSPDFNFNQQAISLRDALFLCNTENLAASSSTWNSDDHFTKSGTYKQLLLELDPSFHPVLSFPSDLPLHLPLKTLLKKYEVQGDPLGTSDLGLESKTSPSNEHSQYKAYPRQWSCSKYQAVSGISQQLPERRKKRHLSETAIGASSIRLEALSFHHEEQESQNHFTGAASGDTVARSSHNTSLQFNSRRRLRSESSYDIDNIVIPMSLVAPSKLEKLQYKEILTPSWRTVSLEPLGNLHEDEEKAEDLSDRAYSLRHAVCEEKERARWSLWEHFRWPKRNRLYSRSSEGHDPVPKEKHSSSDLNHHFAANAADVITPEINSSACLRELQSSERNQEARTLLWERRVFPLKDVATAALICQDPVTVQQRNSDVALHCDSDVGISHAAFSLRNAKQPQTCASAADLEDGGQVDVGNGSTRKQR